MAIFDPPSVGALSISPIFFTFYPLQRNVWKLSLEIRLTLNPLCLSIYLCPIWISLYLISQNLPWNLIKLVHDILNSITFQKTVKLSTKNNFARGNKIKRTTLKYNSHSLLNYLFHFLFFSLVLFVANYILPYLTREKQFNFGVWYFTLDIIDFNTYIHIYKPLT